MFCCIACGAEAADLASDCRCPQCHDLLEWVTPAPTTHDLRERWQARKAAPKDEADRSGVWRFRELLPPCADLVSLGEGNTPLYDLPRLASRIAAGRLLAKHQGMNPTGSFKDTGMTVAVSQARAAGCSWLACASTGNTSASMAAYAARAGLRSLVLVPEGKIARGKLAQAIDYGALICQLATDFDGCVRALSEVVPRAPLYLANSVNPFRLEGQKTAAVEMLEQLEWQVPDHLLVPGGNLANSSALGKALIELKTWGLIDRLPKLSIVQAEGANPFARWLRGGRRGDLEPMTAKTAATAIQIGNPASWKKAARVLDTTGGACIEVNEIEIEVAKAEIGGEGIGCEPASAAALAGARKLIASGFIGNEDTVVLLLTGHMLKDPEYTLERRQGELLAAANADAILQAMESNHGPRF
ncbi:MAG TPA: threonine synthase [Terriglobales bacterium]|nr:threonine synthase [Terriglobales bacterium]